MTKYRLSVLSGVPHATLNNICSGRSRIEKCSAETLYKLAQILHVTIEDLIIDSIKRVEPPQNAISFELFKSNICHRIKDSGDITFIIERNTAILRQKAISSGLLFISDGRLPESRTQTAFV